MGRRIHALESLEVRQLLASDTWTNPVNHLDVNADGNVTALDALGIVDDLNLHGPRRLRILASDANSGTQLQALAVGGASSGSTSAADSGSSYVDVNGDGSVTPADVLMIMDHLNLVATQVQVRLLVTDLQDCPITQVRTGQQFKLHALVKDVRDQTESVFGVFAAYADVTFQSNLASFASPFTYGPDYQNQKSGTIDNPNGLLDEVGAFSGNQAGLGKNELELFSVVGTAASTTGTINFAGSYGNGEGHETLIYGNLNGRVPVPASDVQYIGASLQVVDTPLLSIPCMTSINEGTGGTTNQVFTITIPGGVSSQVTFVAQTADGTAVAGQDYVAKSQTFTFNTGDTSKRFTVQVVGDDVLENNETYLVKLSGATGGAGIQVDTSTSTITDDDSALISIGAASSPEGNPGNAKSVTFTLALSAASSTPVTVQYATQNGTAVAGTDFTATSGTATFAPGSTTTTVSVPIIPNTTVTGNRAFTLLLTNPSPGAPKIDFDSNQATGTIVEDDVAVPVKLSINDVTVAENGSNAVFTVTLSATASSQVTVAFATANGTATAGSDYTAQSGTLTFAPGDTTKQITVAITDDTVAEGNETFSVTLSNPAGATLDTKFTGTGTITDNDTASLTINDVTVSESAGTAVFTVTLAASSLSPVTVAFATANGTATAGSDYTAQSGTLTFAPGDTTKQITVAIAEDAVAESNETFTVTLSNPTGATLGGKVTGTGTINDNDVTKISINDASVVEGNSGTANLVFTVTLSNAASGAVTVVVTTSDETATAGSDYTAKTETLTFAAGETSKSFTVAVLGDAAFEPNETLKATLSSPTGGAQLNTKIVGTGTITNDDGPKVSVGDVTVSEGNAGTTDLVFTVSLDAAPATTGTVKYTVSPGTATTPSDYTAGDALSGTLTFASGEQTKTVTVKVVGDTLYESDETLTLALSELNQLSAGAKTTATGTITNDDAAPHLSIDSVSLPEGTGATDTDFVFTVTLSAAAGKDIVAVYNTLNDTATSPGDYTAISAAGLTLAAGATTGKITVKVKADSTLEANETFKVVLASVDDNQVVIDNGGVGIGTIQNDDTPPTLSIGTASVAEGSSGGGAQSDLVYTVTLSAAAGVPVTVGYFTQDGAGAKGATVVDGDYVAQNGSVTFAPGETSKSITVKVNQDTVVETSETLQVVLESPTNATIGTGTGTGTIVNDDGFTVAADTPSKDEGQSGTTPFVFTVTLSAAQADALTVRYTTVDGTAKSPQDYAETLGTLTFAPGTTTQKVTVLVNGDISPEANETFKLKISAADPLDADSILTSEATATIVDDDLADLTIDDAMVDEGNSGQQNLVFTLHISRALDVDLFVPYLTQDTGSATSQGQQRDYEPLSGTGPNSQLTIAAGQTTATITVKVNGDTFFENDETFRLVLQGQGITPPGKVRLADGEAQGTIKNDDAAPVFSISNVTKAEGNSGQTDFVFTVTMSGQTELVSRVVYATSDVTASAPNDYVAQQGTLTFNIGQGNTAQITVKVKGDTLLEDDETFKVTLSDPIGGTISTTAGEGIGTIQDDEPKPALSVVDAGTVVEGTGGTTNAVFTVTLSGETVTRTDNVTVVFTTISDAAVGGQDFTSQTGTLTFAPNETSKAITVAVTPDTIDEADEQFFVELSSPKRATLAKARGSATIQDDDAAPTLSIAAVSQAEGTSATAGATSDFVFNVTLSSASGRPVTVVFATADGTSATTTANAFAGKDYTAQSGTLTFAPGEITKAITVKVAADNLIEADQSFSVSLSAPTNATLATATGLGTIQNDDNAGNGGVAAGSLSGTVFIDTNNDGIQNNGEMPLSSVTLRMVHGSVVETAVTNSLGQFNFVEVPAGTFTLEQVQPAAYLNGQKSAGSNGSQVTPAGDNSFTVNLESGAALNGITFGERGLRPEFISKRLFLASNTAAANLQSLNLTAGAAWFSFDAGWDGVLTAEALGAEGQARPDLALYDVNLKLVAASNRNDALPRLDFVGTPGQAYFLRVGGNNNDVDVKVTNVIHQVGDTVTVRGTDAADSFAFQAGASSLVTVNGTRYTFDPAKVRSIVFEGMGGADTMVLTGSTGNDTATVAPGSATMTGSNYSVTVHQVADIELLGGGGANDQVTVNDSSGNDTLFGMGDALSLTSDLGLAVSIHDFDRVQANSSHGGQDASDVAAVDYIFGQSGPWN